MVSSEDKGRQLLYYLLHASTGIQNRDKVLNRSDHVDINTI